MPTASTPLPSDTALLIAKRISQAPTSLQASALTQLDQETLARIVIGLVGLLSTAHADGTTPVIPVSDAGFISTFADVHKYVGNLSPLQQAGDAP